MNRWKDELTRWTVLALIAAAGLGIEVAPTIAMQAPCASPVHGDTSSPGRSA